MLTTTDASGAAAFSPEESALLYYLGLTRLGQIAGFMEMRDALEYAATTRYAGRPIVQQQRIKDIRVAYEKVGVM